MRNSLMVSEIQVTPIKPNNGLVGFASCSIYGSFYLGNIAIYNSVNSECGYRLVFPTKVLKSGQQIPCVHPYTKEAEQEITKAIAEKYIEIMEQ